MPGYEILRELGRGGMGVVYPARQIKANRAVALKMILAGGHAGSAELTRFQTEAQAIAAKQGSAAIRLREMMTTINRMNSERYLGDSKLHEMVEVAMVESWDVCVAHMELITRTIAEVIAQGVASGEFHAPDVPLAAMCSCSAMIRFFHPQIIAQSVHKPGPTIDQMIDFVIAGLAPHGEAKS